MMRDEWCASLIPLRVVQVLLFNIAGRSGFLLLAFTWASARSFRTGTFAPAQALT
ncbi:hypothetical protein Cflav_PD0030 [Pedosphaera parvula Ellin514]|uniref:Uncharacterized protein n=1 Tax=Pedosphaera parvula (strain Ellin514) TaxID=320771 RepID=B9XT34_PEDPL|nr:hypothetical protein Cflav_PD0030 [Pedosphaera parvula Ellin514]